MEGNDATNPRWKGKTDHETVRWYQAAQLLRADGNDEIETEIGKLVHASEHGDDSVLSQFEQAYKPVLDGMLETLSRLGIKFDTFTKESKLLLSLIFINLPYSNFTSTKLFYKL